MCGNKDACLYTQESFITDKLETNPIYHFFSIQQFKQRIFICFCFFTS